MKYAKMTDGEEYQQAIKLFIKEEQRHALILGKVMGLNGIQKIQDHWVDSVFRNLRKIATLENSVLVLLTAEIIAAIYYDALKQVSDSQTLKVICDQILKDEEMHINFQSFTLQQFYNERNAFGRKYIRVFHRILMVGTTIVVWLHHGKVLKSGGYRFRKLFKCIFNEFNRAERMIKGVDSISIRSLVQKNKLSYN